MSIEAEITRLVEAKQALGAYLEEKGVTVPNYTLLGDMVALLEHLPLPEGNAIVETHTQVVGSSGEVLVGGATDMRDIDDRLICAFVLVTNSSNYTNVLVVTSTKGQCFTSSLTVDNKNSEDILRFERVSGTYITNCYWMIDPGLYVASESDNAVVYAIWKK